ncbi:MAG: hypothetical protein GX640_17710 [Fibrobacter sp.]|nr:hypothetical protein [Fibrobacter sp.]
MKKLIAVWIIAFAFFIAMIYYLKVESTNFHGIADGREIIIANENAVRIKKIHVVPGQLISQGDSLLELHRPELDLEILKVNNELEKLSAAREANSGFVNSQINQIRAEGQTKINEILTEIAELKAQHSLNVSLASELKSIKSNSASNSKNDVGSLQVKIANLENVLKSVTEEMNVQIRDLRKSPQHALQAQIDNFKEQLKLLKLEQEKLFIGSPINGKIGSVKFKEGVNVSAFDTIITLHSIAPSYINGYIQESVFNDICVGQEVLVTSISNKKERVKGVVVGVGTRIVPLPARLWKRPDIEAWGREVQVKIPDNNSFLLGEKVLITIKEKFYE